ncbi:hypothetical protein HHK36_013822 [Tetracentron sinense]|uniref:WRKY domain-containing protein n=1 Tax=Tetracentron sinense TaxID=13715 RepID=A0A834Z8U8_TETSI|nr:hypothetical protein HHK36_013822 [Tetracentron sinense]
MADNESLKSQKEEEREVEKLLHKQQKCLHSIAVPSRSSVEVEFREESSQSETLAVILSNPASENDHGSNCCYFSELLSGAMASPVSNSMELLSDGLDLKRAIPTGSVDPTGFPMVSSPPLLDPDGFKVGRFGMSNQEVLASESTEAQAQEQLQAGYASSPSELSLNSLTQSMSSALSATPLQQRLSPVPKDNSVCIPEVNQQNSSDQKSKAARVIVKTPSTDEYNWRKYGQKQVKSTQSSRSYYKCTNSDCHAKKKVEHSDHSGRVTEIIYKGQHNHCPPRKIKCTRARRLVSSAGPIIGSKTIDCPVQKLNDSDPSMHRRELTQETLPTPELKRQSSSGSDGNVGNRAEEEHGDEPEPKRRQVVRGICRMKESSVAYLLPPFKTVKEPKIVVQAAGDVGISGDGYRWRKYGQKMVKGNPHPR